MSLSPRCGCHHVVTPPSRRDFLCRAGAGFGGLALAALLGRDAPAAGAAHRFVNPLAPKPPQFRARARSVIWCFMDGGPSHLDLFDPKPALLRFAGHPLPPSFKVPMTAMGVTAHTPLLPSQRRFRRYGRSGTYVSDWLPEIASCVDDIAVVHSCTADGLTHVAGVGQMNTGSVLAGRPSVGAWALYGLGTESEDLPGFVVLSDYPE